MQITSVRYRELVSLRGCEHKALEATVGLGDSPQLLSECRPVRPDLIDYKVDGGSDAGDALEVRVRNHPVSSVKSHGWQHNS
jgi:hypothetical protein